MTRTIQLHIFSKINNKMVKVFLTFISIALILPICNPQVIGWGTQNSIASPFNLSTYFQNYTNGINDYSNWPNGIVPYVFDYNSTLSMSFFLRIQFQVLISLYCCHIFLLKLLSWRRSKSTVSNG